MYGQWQFPKQRKRRPLANNIIVTVDHGVCLTALLVKMFHYWHMLYFL